MNFRTLLAPTLQPFRKHFQAHPHPAPRRVVYTCLFGYSEPFLDLHLERDAVTDFVCITDDASLRSDFWTIVQAPRSLLDPHRRAKGFKHRPHLMFPEHAESLYIDNTVKLVKSHGVFFDLLAASRAPILMFSHPHRQCVYAEATEVRRIGYDKAELIDEQMAYYKSMDYPERNGLHATTVMARRHNEPHLIAAMNDWHNQVLRYSKRDQLSFDVIRHFHALEVGEFAGNLVENDLIEWPIVPGGRRIPRDFDDIEYLKLHPDVAATGVNPRRHFLTQGIEEGRAYRLSDPYVDTRKSA